MILKSGDTNALEGMIVLVIELAVEEAISIFLNFGAGMRNSLGTCRNWKGVTFLLKSSNIKLKIRRSLLNPAGMTTPSSAAALVLLGFVGAIC